MPIRLFVSTSPGLVRGSEFALRPRPNLLQHAYTTLRTTILFSLPSTELMILLLARVNSRATQLGSAKSSSEIIVPIVSIEPRRLLQCAARPRRRLYRSLREVDEWGPKIPHRPAHPLRPFYDNDPTTAQAQPFARSPFPQDRRNLFIKTILTNLRSIGGDRVPPALPGSEERSNRRAYADGSDAINTYTSSDTVCARSSV